MSRVARVVLATRNAHKVEELNAILSEVVGELHLEVVGVTEFPEVEDVVESGVTFAENATLKAVQVCQATGMPSLADDSGLAVDVLGGCPGVFSARWSGVQGPDKDRANNQLLLSQLGDVPDAHRAAAFVCAAVLAMPDGTVRVQEGRVSGRLGRAPRGSGGFGYDPLLIVDGGERTLAEFSPAEKNAISHRGKAFRALAADLRELLA
ncbi:MAG TPA: RdgB/HAM1 family non-canonical purine NTP pyrophosphatase [Segeticoccus sp.]|uniref:RdgB/HAM1 family non-canonical purine NTP pyrophosphatase n=1 Tax=Segeticoccus sp. TaxID=2706531 RepID=UPI002D804203|nr:RdgB/HAM1 family non-canonical purine NTP pyrophosphatase [Segeticoccus sp.]HET8600112.1 RdgB/HAM1 family non-canonical purine NTP pyrophosphatase [Segeticoccus sp.]